MMAKAKSNSFTAEERAAMQDRVRELKKAKGSDGEADVLAKIAEMAAPDRKMAERLHALVKNAAPDLEPKTWYGMPAYARDGKVVCFFQSGKKFKTRYATLGFSDSAHLDDGEMWATAFALMEWNAVTEKKIRDLVMRASAVPSANPGTARRGRPS